MVEIIFLLCTIWITKILFYLVNQISERKYAAMTIRLLSRLPCNKIIILLFIIRLMDTFNRVLTSSRVEPCPKSMQRGEFYSEKCLNWKRGSKSYKNCCVVNYQTTNISNIFRNVFIDELTNTSVMPYLYKFIKDDVNFDNVKMNMSLYFDDLSIRNCNKFSVSMVPETKMSKKKSNLMMVECWARNKTKIEISSLSNIHDVMKIFNECIIKGRVLNKIKLNSSDKYCHIIGQNKSHESCNKTNFERNKQDSWKINIETSSTDLKVVNVTREFPIHEFFRKHENVTVTGDLRMFMCSSGRERCCSCDETCAATKSCCIDKLWNPNQHADLDSYLNALSENTTNQKTLSCQPIVTLKDFVTVDYVAMVTGCLPGSTADDKALCFSDSNFTFPVIGLDGYVYKNAYCAQCNDITQYDTINITAQCHERPHPQNISDFINNINFSDILEKCIHIDFNSSDLIDPSFMHCNSRPSSRQKRCNKNLSHHYDLCHAYSGPIGSYANIHCYLCNHDDRLPRDIITLQTSTLCEGTQYGRLVAESKAAKFESQPKARWSMFISFMKWEKMVILICGGEYQNQNNVCVTFSCVIGYEKVYSDSWSCREPDFLYPKTEIEEPDFEKCLFSYKPTLFLMFDNNVLDQLVSPNLTLEEDFVTFYTDTNVTVLSKRLSNKTNLGATIKLNSKSTLTKLAQKIFIFPFENPLKSDFYGFNLSRSYPRNRMCAQTEYIKPESINFTSSCDVLYNKRNISNMNISIFIEINNQNGRNTTKIFTCNQYHLHSKCSIRNITSKNGLTEEEYIPIKNGYQVCSETVPQWLSYLVHIEAYFSVIGSSASIISYIFIIMSILVFKKLRNISGLCSLALSSCLLLADGIFLLMLTIDKLQTHMICHVLGLSMHYCLIMAHVWAVIIAFDVSSKFSSFFYSSSREVQRKKFYRYCIIAFTHTTIFEIVSIITDVTNLLHFGYGEDQRTCFIQGFYARLIFYIIPAMVTSVFTFGSFLYILVRIALRKRSNKAFLRRSKRNNLSIFFIGLKLAFIFGSIELIGFIQIPDPASRTSRLYNSVVFILYSILRSLRGVLLFTVHICRRDVIRQYRESIRLYIQSE